MSAVVLAAYDERWPAVFAALRDVYLYALGDLATAVEHVGSTAIPGMLAKPVIDIDIVTARGVELPRVAAALARLGYRHNGCQGIPGREAFKRDDRTDVPRDGSGRSWPAHNLYACSADATELHRHLVFRDWLRTHPERAVAYADLKRELALVHGDDRDAYCEAKTEFVEMTLRLADASRRGTNVDS